MDNQESGVETEVAAQVENVQEEHKNGGSIESREVPLEALQAERAQRQALQQELRVIKDHIALMQANQNMKAQKDDLLELSDDDVLTVGEAKKLLEKVNRPTQMTIEELKMTQRYPDYEQVISKYLPEVLNQNPKLRHTLQQTQDYELAYYLAKNSDACKSSNQKQKQNADAQRIVENSQKAGSLSSMGGTSPVNTARRYKDMSDEDFRALMNRNRGAY